MQLKAGYLKGLCQARPKWVNKNNQRRSSDNPGVQAEKRVKEIQREKTETEQKNVSLPYIFLLSHLIFCLF